MISKLVASQLAGSNVGRSVGPLMRLAENVGSVINAGLDAPKGLLNKVQQLLGGNVSTAASTTTAVSAGSGVTAFGGASITAAVAAHAPVVSNIPVHTWIHPAFAQPSVGGVLFNKAASVLTEIEEISGAYWDEKVGQLVILGKANGGVQEQYLPRMDKDHLAVALRAVFSDDNLGVSIDPPPSYLQGGDFPPDGTMMQVRYLGATEGTLFGTILFEADRLLKILSTGKDNETRVAVTSNVRGFQNELDLQMDVGATCKSAWHRMWFVIDNMEIDLRVKETSDRNAISFGKALIKIKAEYLSKDKGLGANAAAERFVEHFTMHYNEFAQEYPVLERLRELAKISAIAKWLRNSGKPLDLSFLHDYEIKKVPTFSETPGIRVRKSKTWQQGNITNTQTYMLFGGVDFDFKYRTTTDDGEAFALKKMCQGSKPTETSTSWIFQSHGKPQRALTIDGPKGNGFMTRHVDLSIPFSGPLKLQIERFYNSAFTKPSAFGNSWTLYSPCRIFVLNPHKPDSPLLLINTTSGLSQKYYYVEAENAYHLINGEKIEHNRVSFTYDPNKFIKRDSNGVMTLMFNNDITYKYDVCGRLIGEFTGGKGITYTYQNDLLVELSCSTGQIELIYDKNRRIREVVAKDFKSITYDYDPAGNLARVSDTSGGTITYLYDNNQRLVQTICPGKVSIHRVSYDSIGRVVRRNTDEIVDSAGKRIVRTYDSLFRLIKEEDREGNCVSHVYDKGHRLISTVLNDALGNKAIFEYDELERIRKVTDPMGNVLGFNYDPCGNIVSLFDESGESLSIEYDANSNPTVISGTGGIQLQMKFDDSSHLVDLIDSTGQLVNFSYDGDKITEIGTIEGTTYFDYDKRGNLTKVTDPMANTTEYFYDIQGRIIKVKDAAKNMISYQYSVSGDLHSLKDDKGNEFLFSTIGSI